MPSLTEVFYRLFLIPEYCIRFIKRKAAFTAGSVSNDTFTQSVRSAVFKAEKKQLPSLSKNDAENLLNCREKVLSDGDFQTGMMSAAELRRLAYTVSKKNIWTVFLYNLIYNTKPLKILELGTGIGVSSLFLAKAASSYGGAVVSVERDSERHEIAKKLSVKYEINNIRFVLSDFEEYFAGNIENRIFDLIFMDGAHNYYFLSKNHSKIERLLSDGGTLIYDDIHYSRGMNRFWKEVSRMPRFRTVIDLFQLGILKESENDKSILIKYVLPTIN